MGASTISSRKFVMEMNGKDYPVFVGNFPAYIDTVPNGNNTHINDRLRDNIRSIVYELYCDKLGFPDRIKTIYSYKRLVRSKDVICFINDEGMVGFDPYIGALNGLLDFCRKYNCMDVLEAAIYKIGDYFIHEPNKKINPDIIANIRYNKHNDIIRFKWAYTGDSWSVTLTER